MKQAIAGVVPSDVAEVEIMTVWPSNARYGLGRLFGRLYGIQAGFGRALTVGNLFALLTFPGAMKLYLWRAIMGDRYRLTNRRVVIQKALSGKDGPYVDLDRFDAIDLVVRPGQAWYPAGDLIFRLGNVETFRLEGVARPEPFRQTCLKARNGYVGVAKSRPQPVGA